MCTNVIGSQKRPPIANRLELELYEVVICLLWVLRTKLGSYGKAAPPQFLFSLLRQGLSLAWSLPRKLGWLASKLQIPACLSFHGDAELDGDKNLLSPLAHYPGSGGCVQVPKVHRTSL